MWKRHSIHLSVVEEKPRFNNRSSSLIHFDFNPTTETCFNFEVDRKFEIGFSDDA